MNLKLRNTESSAKAVTIRLSALYFFYFFGLGAYIPLLSLYLKQYGLSGLQIGMLLSAGPIVSILVQPVWGIISDRYQAQRRVLILALFAAMLAGLVYPAVGGHFVWLLTLYVMMILFQSAVLPIMDAVTLAHAHKHKGDYGSVRMYGALGFALAVWVAGQIAAVIDLYGIFYLYGLAFLICIFLALTLPQEEAPITASVWSGIGSLLKIPQYLVFLVAAFLIFGPINANNSYFSLFYTAIGGAVTGVGLAFLLFAGSEAPIMRISGKFAKRYGLLLILIVSGLVAGARWLYYSTQPNPTEVLWLFLLQGLSVGFFLPTAASFIQKNTPQEVQVTAQAIYAAVGNGLGTVVASYIAGLLLDNYGIFSTYRYFAFSSVAGSVLLLILYFWTKAPARTR